MTEKPVSNLTQAIASEIFDGDRISINTVKEGYLPNNPSIQALVHDYETRTANGETLCIYRVEGMMILGPPIEEL